MNRRFALLLLSAAFSGCATFDQAELNQVRSRGVSSSVVAKLDRGDPVAPADVIELTRRGVSDLWIVRQIEDHGVDSLITRDDVARMRRAGVRAVVIDTMLQASDQFANSYRYPDVSYYGSSYDDPYFGWYDPYPRYWAGGVGATFVVPFDRHRHHH